MFATSFCPIDASSRLPPPPRVPDRSRSGRHGLHELPVAHGAESSTLAGSCRRSELYGLSLVVLPPALPFLHILPDVVFVLAVELHDS